MKEDIKKITIQNTQSKKKLSPKKDVIKKLASEPDKISTFIKDKITNIQKNELKSWIVPPFFSKKTMEEQPNRIESIIKDIQTHRKMNPILSKKREKRNVETNKNSIDKSKNKQDNTNSKTINKDIQKQRGGRLKSRKEGRIYTKNELKDLYKTLCELYKNGETKRITSILRRLTKNQCNQILHHQKIIKRSWTNAPLPLLRFLVYQLISCPNMKVRHIL